jgi:hypothetical protein
MCNPRTYGISARAFTADREGAGTYGILANREAGQPPEAARDGAIGTSGSGEWGEESPTP